MGVDDPQLLALVFSRAGVYVYLRGDRRGWALELAALLFVAGGNIKHNMIEFPLAVLLNLVISSPRRALRFAVGDALMVALSIVLTSRIDGAAYLSCLLSPRSYSGFFAMIKLRNWLGPIFLPLVAAVWEARRCWKNPAQRVLALLLYCALAVNAYFCGGRGVAVNGVRILVVVYGLSMLLGVKLNWSPLSLVNVLAIVILAATLFSTFSLVIACIVKTRERFMGVGQVLTMPLFFASNAIYPTTIMPAWLKVISHLNPLTYVVDALCTSMLAGSASSFGLGLDYAVILLTTIVMVFIGSRLYPQLGV